MPENKNPNNVIIRHGTRDDIPEILDVIDASFKKPYYGGDRANPNEKACFDYLYHRKDFCPEWNLVAEDASTGRIVSIVGAHYRPSYIEGVPTESWMLNPAATLHEYRGRGIMVRLIRMLNQYVWDQGGSLVFFHGVPEYYSRAGYTKCLATYRLVLPVSQVVKSVEGNSGKTGPGENRPGENRIGEKEYCLTTATPEDAQALARVWDGEARGGFLALRRTVDWWQRELSLGDPELAGHIEHPFPDLERLHVLRGPAGDGPGSAMAYASISEDPEAKVLNIIEGAAVDDGAASQLWTGLARLAQNRGLKEFGFNASPRNSLVRTGMGNFMAVLRYRRPSAGFALLVNPGGLLKSLEPALSARWKERGWPAQSVQGTVALRVWGGADAGLQGQRVLLRYGRDGIVVDYSEGLAAGASTDAATDVPTGAAEKDWIDLSYQDLTRLTLGSALPGENLMASLGIASGEARRVLTALFPPEHPDPGQNYLY